MPIYEYVCKACGHELETLQFLNEEPLTDCPACNAVALRRKISAAGFRLGGKGWYETDFKSGDRQRNLAGDKEPQKDKGDKADKVDKSDKKDDKSKQKDTAGSPAAGKAEAKPQKTEKSRAASD